MNRIKPGRIVFNVINTILLAFSVLIILLPIFHVVSVSLSSKEFVVKKIVGIWPLGFAPSAYINMLTKPLFLSSFLNSIFITVTYAFFFVLFNLMAAFAFTRNFLGKKIMTYFFLIPAFFSGGLIPYYILVTQYLRWYNSYLALIVSAFFSFFYMVIIRGQIEAIPPELAEATRIDGGGEFSVLFRVILPSIKGTIAAVAMFGLLGKWNSWFEIMIFTNDSSMWNLQYLLRSIIMDKTMLKDMVVKDVLDNINSNITGENYKMAAIVLTALPVVVVYPFIQKYFVKGLLAGSVKG